MICPKCQSENVGKYGMMKRKSGDVQRFKCKDCKTTFTEATAVPQQSVIKEFEDLITSKQYVRDDAWIQSKTNGKTKFVITSAQSGTPVSADFLAALNRYCSFNNATLLVIPVRYRNPTAVNEVIDDEYPSEIEEFLFENNIKFHEKLKVLGLLKVASTAEHPLRGLAPLSKGDSVIIGHNQLQMTTLPVQINDHPVIMTTTGTVSEKNYSSSKQGYKAEFNHSNSAVVVELDGDLFHIRHLNFDGTGFYDFNRYYSAAGHDIAWKPVQAIVTGDEHAIFFDEKVKEATYGPNGIVSRLDPKYIIRHDVLDCYSISHHHNRNFLTKFKKYVSKTNDIATELDKTIDFIVETTPKNAINVIVPSNHIDHLTRWLNECDIRNEPWNALVYHWLMFNMLQTIKQDTESSPNPFELYSQKPLANQGCSVEFLDRRETYKISDIEIAVHGDKGTNGARGTRDQFAKLPSKTIIGHSHSPGIEKGCYQVGTSSKLTLEYNDGPSSWMNTHCIIYANGKRQLINVIDGKWRA